MVVVVVVVVVVYVVVVVLQVVVVFIAVVVVIIGARLICIINKTFYIFFVLIFNTFIMRCNKKCVICIYSFINIYNQYGFYNNILIKYCFYIYLGCIDENKLILSEILLKLKILYIFCFDQSFS